MGLENHPICRDDGRIHRYRSTLSEGAFHVLQKLVVQVADQLEKMNHYITKKPFSHQEKAHIIQILSTFTLEELASNKGLERLEAAYSNAYNS